MKTISFGIGILCLLTACNAELSTELPSKSTLQENEIRSDNPVSPLQEEAKAEPTPTDTAALSAFNTFVEKLPTDRIEQMKVVVQEYKTTLADAPQSQADLAFVTVYKFQRKLSTTLSRSLYEELNHDPAQESYQNRWTLLDSLADYGLQTQMAEGEIYLAPDLDFLATHFYPQLSASMQAFLGQSQLEDREGFTEDAGLTISPKQVGERVIFWDAFALRYPDFILKQEVQDLRLRYRIALLHGTDNTPAFDYVSGQLTREFEQAFDYLIGKYPKTELGRLLTSYKKNLRDNDWRMTPEVERFLRRQQVAYKPNI